MGGARASARASRSARCATAADASLGDGGTVAVMDPGADARRGARAARVRRARRPRGRRRAARLAGSGRCSATRGRAWDDDGPGERAAARLRAGDHGRRRVRPRATGAGRGARRGLRLAAARRARRPRAGRAARRQLAAPEPPARRGRQRRASRSRSAARGPLTFVESVHGYGPRARARGDPGPLRLGADRARCWPRSCSWSPAAAASARRSASAATCRRRGAPTSTRWRRRWRAARTREEAVAPVREEARRRLARRAGLPRGRAATTRGCEAARAAGLDEDEARALSGRAKDDEAVVADRARARGAGRRPETRRRDGCGSSTTRSPAEVAKVVVGQGEVVATLLAAAALGGHVLLEGPPGVAKTLLANAVARALGVEFRRVQFTPDMLPSDLTGNVTLRGGELSFRPRAGVHQRAAGRRDQPHAAEDPGRAARGDAGAPGVGRGPARAAARPVPGRRHAEPDRVRGHLPAARGAARPLPGQARRRLPVARTRSWGCSGSRAAASAPGDLDEVRAGGRRRTSCAGARARSTRRASSEDVARYVVDVVRRTRELPSVELGASPRAAVHLLGAAARRRAARGPRLRDARRRRRAWRRPCCATGSCSRPRPSSSATGPTTPCATALGDVPVPR